MNWKQTNEPSIQEKSLNGWYLQVRDYGDWALWSAVFKRAKKAGGTVDTLEEAKTLAEQVAMVEVV